MTEKQSSTLCAGGVMAFGALGVVLCLGCAWPGGSPSTADVAVEFVRERHGGLCPGPDGGDATCRSRIVVLEDGTWSSTGTESPTPAAGAVRPGAASDLASILDEEWDALTARANCPRARTTSATLTHKPCSSDSATCGAHSTYRIEWAFRALPTITSQQ
jgi:hypothetical protein